MKTNLRTIAYCTDTLRPGLYFWFWKLTFQFGGTELDLNYPYIISSFCGFAIVLKNFKSVSLGVKYA